MRVRLYHSTRKSNAFVSQRASELNFEYIETNEQENED